MKLENICNAVQESPVGSVSVVASTFCGVLYLVKVGVPLLAGNHNPFSSAESNLVWVMVVGSGIAFLLALLSFGLERRTGPAVVSLCVLAVTENVVFAAMLFWTLMLLEAWSAWAVLAYIAAFFLAIALIVRRAITGKVVLNFPLQPSRCPSFAIMKSHPGSQ